MSSIALITAISSSLLASAWAFEVPETIRLIVAGSRPPLQHSMINVQVYDITNIGKTARTLSAQLSKRQPIAEGQARLRIEKNLAAIRDAMRMEIELQNLIERFGITKVPAAVVNDRWLIYGAADVDEIVARWQAIAR